MTICISAVCEDGAKIVVASDRMYTSPPPLNVEFETEASKIETFRAGVVVLPAGNTAVVTEILMEAGKAFGRPNPPDILGAAEALRSAFENIRATKAEIQFALPLVGKEFIGMRKSRGVLLPNYLQPQPQTYQQISIQMAQFDLGTELLVVGYEDQTARIGVIVNPGQLFWLDKLGYGAIGSGGIHALATLNLSGQMKSQGFYQTLYAVFRAKCAAEVAPGVGEKTDLGVIDRATGQLKLLAPPVLEALKDMIRKEKEAPPPDMTSLISAYKKAEGTPHAS